MHPDQSRSLSRSDALRTELDAMRAALYDGVLESFDLHVHDAESRVPDERIGVLLGVRETWVESGRVTDCLSANGLPLLTITNHNNARTCWQLLDRGHDVLPSAEFTCRVPDVEVSVHVLTYGFTPDQEATLAAKRDNILHFLSYCRERDIPTVLAHPKRVYAKHHVDPADLDILLLLFDRFEVLNGQRSADENLRALQWVRGLTPEKLAATENRLGVTAAEFCTLKTKAFTGGSDDHFGQYAGAAHTCMPLAAFPAQLPRSQRALMAIKQGRICPAGGTGYYVKKAMAVVQQFVQTVDRIEPPDPIGLLRDHGFSKDSRRAAIASAMLGGIQRVGPFRRYARLIDDALQAKPVAWPIALTDAGEREPLLQQLEMLAASASLPNAEKLASHAAFLDQCPATFARLLLYGSAPPRGELTDRILFPLFAWLLFAGARSYAKRRFRDYPD